MGCTNFMHKKYLNFVIFSLALLMFQQKSIAGTDTKTMLLTHKTPTCGCCKEWVKHAKEKASQFIHKIIKTLKILKKCILSNQSIDLVIQPYLQMVLFSRVIYH